MFFSVGVRYPYYQPDFHDVDLGASGDVEHFDVDMYEGVGVDAYAGRQHRQADVHLCVGGNHIICRGHQLVAIHCTRWL